MGTTTVMALRRHGFATAVALEPSPQNAWLCRLNLVANGLDERVTLLPYAASNRAEEMDLVIGGGNRGGHRVMSAGSDHPGQAGSVRSVTLDEPRRRRHDRSGSGRAALVRRGWPRRLRGARRVAPRGGPGAADRQRLGRDPGGDPGAFVGLLAPHYAEVVELRKAQRTLPIDELADLVAGYRHKGDVLLVPRRP